MSRVVLLASGCVVAASAVYLVAVIPPDVSVSGADIAAVGMIGLLVVAAVVLVLGRRRSRG